MKNLSGTVWGIITIRNQIPKYWDGNFYQCIFEELISKFLFNQSWNQYGVKFFFRKLGNGSPFPRSFQELDFVIKISDKASISDEKSLTLRGTRLWPQPRLSSHQCYFDSVSRFQMRKFEIFIIILYLELLFSIWVKSRLGFLRKFTEQKYYFARNHFFISRNHARFQICVWNTFIFYLKFTDYFEHIWT